MSDFRSVLRRASQNPGEIPGTSAIRRLPPEQQRLILTAWNTPDVVALSDLWSHYVAYVKQNLPHINTSVIERVQAELTARARTFA